MAAKKDISFIYLVLICVLSKVHFVTIRTSVWPIKDALFLRLTHCPLRMTIRVLSIGSRGRFFLFLRFSTTVSQIITRWIVEKLVGFSMNPIKDAICWDLDYSNAHGLFSLPC